MATDENETTPVETGPVFDPRTTPARPDLAALHLQGQIEAHTYASGQPMRATVALAPLSDTPDAEGEMASQLLFGEDFMAYEVEGGWVWGQSAFDGYVGYTPEACFSPMPADTPAPSHKICAMQALVYPEPNLKARPIGALPFGARVSFGEHQDGYVALDVGGWAPLVTLAPAGEPKRMWVSTAERFKGVPYLWGGRSPAGIDCSGLIQAALHSAGFDCPRDSDQQMASIGREVSPNGLKRGDIVFWKGHVGVMTSPTRLLHANAHHMEVAEEAFEAARTRIAEKEFGEVLMVRRITV
jgi:cell wall-associated NlpC family hydrolase